MIFKHFGGLCRARFCNKIELCVGIFACSIKSGFIMSVIYGSNINLECFLNFFLKQYSDDIMSTIVCWLLVK